MSKPEVGLTGGIATGKSTVASLFAELGIPTVDADALARQVVEVGTDGLREVFAAFGEGVRHEDGSLDRQRLGQIVFNDDDARARLEAIVHPRIEAAAAERLASLQDDPAPYLLYEAALLVEKGKHSSFDALIVVTACPATQLARLRARNGLKEEEARARIASQLSLDEKKRVADYLIDNDGDRERTRTQVVRVHEQLVERFQRIS